MRIFLQQEPDQFLDCPATVTNAVFYIGLHFRKRMGKTIRPKNGIIPKPITAMSFAEDFPVDTTFEKVFIAFHNEGNDTAETSTPVLFVFQFGEYFIDVVF